MKNKIISFGVFAFLSAIVFVSSFLCSSFCDCRVESIALSIDNYINKSGSDYVLSEVVSNSSNPQEDYFNTEAIAYLNYAFFWNFSSGPQNKTFRKFTPDNDHSPISFSIDDFTINPLIMSSTYAKEIKGDYFGFKIMNGYDWSKIDGSDYIYITEKIANLICSKSGMSPDELIDYEIECKCTSTRFVVKTIGKKIAGIISNDSIELVNEIMGDEFLYIQSSNNYYLRDFCNQTICSQFRSNIVANRTCLRHYLNFEKYKNSSINFYNYNYKTKSFFLGELQNEYIKCITHYSSIKDYILPIGVCVCVAGFVVYSILARRMFFETELFKKIGFIIPFMFSLLITLLLLFFIKKIKMYGFFLPLFNIPFLITVILLLFIGFLINVLIMNKKTIANRSSLLWEEMDI